MICGARVVAKQLPCEFGTSLETLRAAIDELQPDVVLAVGQQAGAATLRWSGLALTSMMRAFPIMRAISPSTKPLWKRARRLFRHLAD